MANGLSLFFLKKLEICKPTKPPSGTTKYAVPISRYAYSEHRYGHSYMPKDQSATNVSVI